MTKIDSLEDLIPQCSCPEDRGMYRYEFIDKETMILWCEECNKHKVTQMSLVSTRVLKQLLSLTKESAENPRG